MIARNSIVISVHKGEMMQLIEFCNQHYTSNISDIRQTSLAYLTLLEWTWNRLPQVRSMWLYYAPKKERKTRFPLTVAKALHEDMQHQELTALEQSFLNKLDQALADRTCFPYSIFAI